MERLEFTAEDPQGNVHTFTDDFLLNSFKQTGQPIVGISDDGMSVKLAPPQPGGEPIEQPWDQLLKSHGYTVVGSKPVNADFDNVQLGWAAMVDKLADDQERKDFLGVKMRGLGHENPRIMGQGSDWFAFNPETAQWVALTNKPGMDAADFVRAGLEIPRFLGSMGGAALGAAAGAPTGPGAIATTAAGAGLGGGLGESLTRGGLALFDDDYAQSVGDNFGSHAMDVGKGSAFDAATVGALKGLGQIPAVGKFLQGFSPVSSTVRGAGATMEGTGALASKAGGFLAKNPVAADLSTMAVPGVGSANAAGQLMSLGDDAVSGIPKALDWAGGKIGGQMGARMSKYGGQLARGAEETLPQQGANWLSKGLHGAPMTSAKEVTAKRVLGNMGQMADARIAAGRGSEELGSYFAAQAAGKQGMLQRAGQATGSAITGIGQVGRGLVNTTRKGMQAAGGAAYGAGKGLQAAGSTMKNLGTLAQPMESYAWGRAGTNELDKWLKEKLRRQSLRDTMSKDLLLAGE